MSELFAPLFQLFDRLIELLPLILTVLVVVALVLRFGLAALVKLKQRWLNYRGKRGLNPATWFKVQPKVYFEIEGELLANPALVTAHTDSNAHMHPRESKEYTYDPAWLSPHPRAVRSLAKANRGLARGKVYKVKQQVSEASKFFTVYELPESQSVVEKAEKVPEDETEKQKEKREKRIACQLQRNHFRIDVPLDGRDPADVRKLEGKMASQLGLHSLQEFPSGNAFYLSYAAHRTEPLDVLTAHKVGIEFFENYPAEAPYLLPLAIRQNGKAWFLPMHHTLIYGMTGSGKGSPLNGMIRQFAPFVNNGTVQLYGIDPKASELKPYEYSTLFKDVVYENTDAQTVIKQIHTLMKMRAKTKTVDVANANLGRSLEATRENPMIVLMIDEFLSLLIALKGMKQEGAASMTLLTEILAQGRSLGIYVVAATQEVDKELLGRMRGNFANIIMFRQLSEYFNDLYLGEGARAMGFDSTKIPLSTKANRYAYAGIGFVGSSDFRWG
ncbi:FtsK/SpoIIIE family protein [Microbacterium lacticum]|uniref:FtsK/SpoIIIE family protein n=2 Tax=Microbacterium lacticum TaxID=33885 RepID=A0A543KUN6_9MICO|nr:FtsK/SpoIIIE domain-containing protein [Microbacterium lacticum]TQM98804.1 FtsK/SpoIIIE family protein [Microbacterium lacticum]